jgi:hypothetical protein
VKGRPEQSHLAVSVEVSPLPLRRGAEARWSIRVMNEGTEPVTLGFATAQRGDVTLERDGVEHWRWSEGAVFAQMMSERDLAPGESWSFPLTGVVTVDPGRYEAIVSVASHPMPPPARIPVEVEALGG